MEQTSKEQDKLINRKRIIRMLDIEGEVQRVRRILCEKEYSGKNQ